MLAFSVSPHVFTEDTADFGTREAWKRETGIQYEKLRRNSALRRSRYRIVDDLGYWTVVPLAGAPFTLPVPPAPAVEPLEVEGGVEVLLLLLLSLLLVLGWLLEEVPGVLTLPLEDDLAEPVSADDLPWVALVVLLPFVLADLDDSLLFDLVSEVVLAVPEPLFALGSSSHMMDQ
jgi:hypothetical protein